jgi:hypothetical protein
MSIKLMLLRGCLFLGTFDAAGKKAAGIELHNTEISLTVEDTFAEHKNTCNAVVRIDARDLVERMVKAKMSIDDLKRDVLGLAFGGTSENVATGASFSAKVFPTVAVGDIVPVPGGYSNLESLSLTDSNGTPATLTAGTHYTADLEGGLVTFLNLASYTQPFKAAGSENDDFDAVGIANEGKQERWGRFKGIDVTNDDLPVIVDFHRLSFSPSEVPLKQSGNEYSVVNFEPVLIADEEGDFDTDLGYYGSMKRANA